MSDKSGGATGVGQQVKEFTLTGTYAFIDRLSGWLEFREDWSNQPFFNRGNEIAVWKNQPTLLLGMVALVGPKH
jgi:Putative beta-barrel porin-2, OmpL-like. bbp2